MCQIADWIVLILLGIAGVIDWKKREIPIWLLMIMSATILLFAICCNHVSIWYRFAGVLLGTAFFIVSKFTNEAVGYGDSWLILLLGVHLGIFKVLQLLFVASLMVAVFALFYLWKHRWRRKATLPFVPFLAITYMGVIFA